MVPFIHAPQQQHLLGELASSKLLIQQPTILPVYQHNLDQQQFIFGFGQNTQGQQHANVRLIDLIPQQTAFVHSQGNLQGRMNPYMLYSTPQMDKSITQLFQRLNPSNVTASHLNKEMYSFGVPKKSTERQKLSDQEVQAVESLARVRQLNQSSQGMYLGYGTPSKTLLQVSKQVGQPQFVKQMMPQTKPSLIQPTRVPVPGNTQESQSTIGNKLIVEDGLPTPCLTSNVQSQNEKQGDETKPMPSLKLSSNDTVHTFSQGTKQEIGTLKPQDSMSTTTSEASNSSPKRKRMSRVDSIAYDEFVSDYQSDDQSDDHNSDPNYSPTRSRIGSPKRDRKYRRIDADPQSEPPINTFTARSYSAKSMSPHFAKLVKTLSNDLLSKYLTDNEHGVKGHPHDPSITVDALRGKECGCENKCVTTFFAAHFDSLGKIHEYCKVLKSQIEDPLKNIPEEKLQHVISQTATQKSGKTHSSKKATKEIVKFLRSDARTRRDQYIQNVVLPNWKDKLCVKGLVAITCTSNAYFYNKRGHGGPRAELFLVRRRKTSRTRKSNAEL